MTDNSSKFNPIKSAGAIILAVLLAAGSVLSVAAAAATPSVKAEAENDYAEVEIYNDLNGSGEDFREFSVYNVSVRHDGVVEKIVFNGCCPCLHDGNHGTGRGLSAAGGVA